jgi:hypothetical protein
VNGGFASVEKTQLAYRVIKKKYDDYVELYLFINNGSSEGITTFAEFYWRFSYYERYADPTILSVGNM